MKNAKKNMRRMFWLLFFLLCLVIGNLIKYTMFDSKSTISNPYNTRLSYIENEIKRGSILSSTGEILASSKLVNEEYHRSYPFDNTFSHIVGYSSKGKSGVEASYNYQLQQLNNEIVQRFLQVFGKKELEGNSVVLTVNDSLQKDAYKKLKETGFKSALVALEPSTGKILAMVSVPDFNPNTVFEDWETLSTDTDNSPLLNRATQGLYPPGSTFKIITSVAGIENIPDFTSFVYDCKGFDTFGDKKIRCYNSEVHGEVDYYKAMAESCNTYFSTIGTEVGPVTLKKVSESFLFNKNIPFDLEYKKSQVPIDSSAEASEIVETSIGQGRTLATPLQMALVTETIANGGIMMKPYIVDHLQTYNNKVINKNLPESMGHIVSSDTTEIIKNAMIEVINTGTGINVKSDKYQIAGKTGTAENSTGVDHGWFVAFAPADNPKIVISVITENSDGTRKLLPKVKDLIENYLDGN